MRIWVGTHALLILKRRLKPCSDTARCMHAAHSSRHMYAAGTVNRKEIEMTYKISRRIEAEERARENAMMGFTSTQEEVDKQWGLYDACAPHGACSMFSCLN